jgi:methionyl-tRNA formyltransferase
MKIALICNTPSAFPLLNWLHSQGVLVGVGTKEQNRNSDFFADLSVVCQQRNLKVQTFVKQDLSQQLSDWQVLTKAELIFVLGFPYKIPKSVLQKPMHGFFNIHYGKLPKYGGSFPVFWQIKNQEKEGVLTIHQMDKSFDSGPIAVEIPFEINPKNTYGIVETNYGHIAINGVFQLLNSILQKNLVLKPQKSHNVIFSPKPTLKDLIIDWQKMDAKTIVALIKACNPWNRGAIARINGIDVRIIEAQISTQEGMKAGQVFHLFQNGMEVACINNTALIVKVLYTSFGYLEGETLGAFGIKNRDVFEKISV